MKRALYVATRFPLPPTGGREQMILQSLKFLSSDYVIDFLFFEKQDPKHLLMAELANILNGGRVLKLSFPNIIEVVISTLFRRDKSLQEHLFFSRNSVDSISSMINDNNYDVVVFDMLRTAQYVEYCNIKGKKVVELDDLLSKRYSRLLNDSKSESNMLGTFQGKFPGMLGWLLGSMLNPILKHEISALTKRELAVTKLFDVVTLTSPLEADFLTKCSGHRSTIGVPPTIDVDSKLIQNSYNVPEFTKEFDIIFTGNLKSPHNLASLGTIFEHVFKDGNSRRYTMVVVGDYTQSDKDKLVIPACVDVSFTGVVDDISIYMKKSKLLLAPIPFGSGIKLKIIDAMANGVPVVTNSIGIEGIPAIHRKHALISDNLDCLLDDVNELVDKPELRTYISKNAFELVADYFSLSKIKDMYLARLSSVV